jgi:hypothetical protein
LELASPTPFRLPRGITICSGIVYIGDRERISRLALDDDYDAVMGRTLPRAVPANLPRDGKIHPWLRLAPEDENNPTGLLIGSSNNDVKHQQKKKKVGGPERFSRGPDRITYLYGMCTDTINQMVYTFTNHGIHRITCHNGDVARTMDQDQLGTCVMGMAIQYRATTETADATVTAVAAPTSVTPSQISHMFICDADSAEIRYTHALNNYAPASLFQLSYHTQPHRPYAIALCSQSNTNNNDSNSKGKSNSAMNNNDLMYWATSRGHIFEVTADSHWWPHGPESQRE